MKNNKYLFFCFFFIITLNAYAGHIAGGEMYYEYLGAGSTAGTDKFRITLRLFRECNPPVSPSGVPTAEMPTEVEIGIFSGDGPLVKALSVSRTDLQIINMGPQPCITNPPEVCYQVGYFSIVTDLPKNNSGYICAFQTCCRTNNIINIVYPPLPNNSTGEGATYTCTIPGLETLGASDVNSSPVFSLKDTTLVCSGNPFKLDFSAFDPDGDSLSYSFCAAYNRGNATSAQNITPSSPPYNTIGYVNGFSGNSPLGPAVTINAKSGLISGIAPPSGSYVVNVCINEWRNGKIISQHRKDFTLKVSSCEILKSKPPLDFTTCNGFTVNFSNTSTGNIQNYFWDFGVAGTNTDTAISSNPSFTYPDTGVYKVMLIVNRGLLCTDTAYTTVGVYPGFFPNFTYVTTCKGFPTQFNDVTTTNYGTVNAWRWDFGNPVVTNDTSLLKNPSYAYSLPGTYPVKLVVGNSKGCIDSVQLNVPVLDKPPLRLTNDTLICTIDTLQLNAVGTGTFTWTPNYNINNVTTQNPLVSPDVPTKYYVTLDAGPGCVNTDSVMVDVKSYVTLSAPKDTTICRGDGVLLQPTSDALNYVWSPAATLNNPDVKNPIATPLTDTRYTVIGNIGKCQATADVNVKVVPYPSVIASGDARICFEDSIQIGAQIVASSYSWSPTTYMLNSNTLNPVVFPPNSTNYIITVRDTLGCPKPVSDTVSIIIIPPVQAFAGNDTNIVINQPLQLNATGGEFYSWSPSIGLNKTDISNPVAILQNNQQYIVKVSTAEGCFAYDTIRVTVFTTPPGFFVPNAFTPNKDGLNDNIRPITAGLSKLYYFSIYNRWGQLVFTTSQEKIGWDGTLNGREQPMGVYVWMAKATTYTGQTIIGKGTITLIR